MNFFRWRCWFATVGPPRSPLIRATTPPSSWNYPAFSSHPPSTPPLCTLVQIVQYSLTKNVPGLRFWYVHCLLGQQDCKASPHHTGGFDNSQVLWRISLFVHCYPFQALFCGTSVIFQCCILNKRNFEVNLPISFLSALFVGCVRHIGSHWPLGNLR